MITETAHPPALARRPTDRWIHDIVLVCAVAVIFVIPAGVGALALFA